MVNDADLEAKSVDAASHTTTAALTLALLQANGETLDAQSVLLGHLLQLALRLLQHLLGLLHFLLDTTDSGAAFHAALVIVTSRETNVPASKTSQLKLQ